MRSRDKRKYYRYAIIGLFVVFVLSTSFFLLSIWEEKFGRFEEIEQEETFLEHEGKKYILNENIETFLVLGLDKLEGASTNDSYNNDKQADFLMLFVLDNKAQTCATIHINRDTMANVNVLGVAGNKIDTLVKQIALAHTYGNGGDISCRNTANAVSDLLLDVDVDHYISLTMDAVPVFNDLVGGVSVTVLDDFTGIDDTLVKGEQVTLTGEQALTYVRSRYGMEDSSNVARMERQRQYITALQEKTQKLIETDEEFIIESTVKMSDYIVSDRSINQLQRLMNKFSAYEFLEINGIEGTYEVRDNLMEFHPSEESVKELVVELFYKEKM